MAPLAKDEINVPITLSVFRDKGRAATLLYITLRGKNFTVGVMHNFETCVKLKLIDD